MVNKTMRKKGLSIIAVLSLAAVVSCVDDMKLQYAKGDGVEKDSSMPDAPGGDRQSFSLNAESGSLRSVIGTGDHIFSEQDLVYLRSEYYTPSVNEDGNARLDVIKAESGKYRLLCLPKGSRYWYRDGGNNPLQELVLPYSQFFRSTADSLAYFPLSATYDGASGHALDFKEIIAAVGISVRGEGALASVHLQNKAEGGLMAGVADYDPEKGFVLKEGVDFVNLNCTDGGSGVSLSPAGTTFYLLLAPGNYSEGLVLSLSSMDHKGQSFDVPAFEIAPGQVKTFEFEYSPDENLLYYEHFDNFVWGGNVKGNPAVSSYAPDGMSSPSASRKGSEEAFTAVGITTPGSAYIQENWSAVKDWTVGQRPSVSADYVRSRNIGDMVYLFRCQEYQGCLSVGGGDANRGGFQPVRTFPVSDAYYGVRLDFDICLRYNTEDNFCTQLNGSGIASSVTVDGQPVQLEDELEGNNTYNHDFLNVCKLRRGDITAPTTERYTDGWHHVRMVFNNLNDMSSLGLWGSDASSSIKHGAFIDNVEIRYVPVEHPEKKLRVLLYNIQNGMWADQGNDFVNFVDFVDRYKPDVCIFCEAQSLWKTGSAEYAGKNSYQLFTGQDGRNGDMSQAQENAQWKALANRFGHSYSAVGGYKDDYPQVVTSIYPITTVKRITSNLAHGAGHFQISIEGKTVNIVTLHMWPFRYAKSVWNASAAKQEASAANLEGYYDARDEVVSILNATAKRTDCGEDWLIMGDTNSVSPLDGPYYDYIENTRWTNEQDGWVLPHLAFRSGDCGRALYDILREGEGSLYTGTGRFMTSTGGAARIDIMYGSESMRRRVTPLCLIVRDNWCDITASAVYDPESDSKHPSVPSDHRPLLVEFDMSK